MDEFGSFGIWLRHRRRELDLTQGELARQVACSEAAIRKIEAGERKPSRQLAGLLAQALHISDTDGKAFIEFARQGVPGKESEMAFIVQAKIPDSFQPSSRSSNLPTFLTSLVDRANDISAVLELITSVDARWVTLIGAPGIGKTRLAIQCAREALLNFKDGVWFVDLSTVRDIEFVIPTIGRSLNHLDPPLPTNLEQLTFGLKEKELLLVLDNFEQVENAAVDVAALLKGCPNIKTLVTSRVPLNVYGEFKYYVPPLSIPPTGEASTPEQLMQFEAVQLFVARARQTHTGFKINAGNAVDIVQVCTRMDGIPLALELAAASLQYKSLAELARLLRPENEIRWLKFIGHPARDLPPRQHTLENVLSWSYTLLTPERKKFFLRLGIFTGRFDGEAAAAICGESGLEVSRADSELEYLATHSLLQQSQVDGRSYWHMLEIIHEFTQSKITSLERKKLQPKLANYYHGLLRGAINDGEGLNFELFFQINGGNLRQALQWAVSAGKAKLAIPLAKDLCDLWEHVGYLREGMDLIQKVLSMPEKADDETLITLLNRVSTLSWMQHNFEYASSLADQAVAIAKVNHLDDVYPMLLNLKGRIYIEQGKYQEGRQVLSECYDLALINPKVLNPGAPSVQLGEIELALGNYAQARDTLKKAISYLNDRYNLYYAMGLTDLAEVAFAMEEFSEAYQLLQDARDVAGWHIRRLLYYLSTLAGYLTLKPDGGIPSQKRAVQIYAAVETLIKYSGEALVPFYLALNTTRIALTRARLDKAEWETAWETGQKWSKEVILARATAGIFD